MRRVAAIAGTAAAILWSVGVFAQGTNFTGKWTPDAEKNAAARAAMGGAAAGGGGGAARAGGGAGGGGGRGAAGGGDMTIAQDAKTLTVTRGTGTPTVYNLDGTASKITMGQTEATATAKWDGAKLVISTTRDGNNGPQTTVQTWSIVDGELLQETAPMQTGGTARKTYYKKAM